MTRYRKIAFGLVVAAPLIVLAAACTFPDNILFEPINNGTEAGTETSSSSSSSSGSPTTPDSTTPIDATQEDTGSVIIADAAPNDGADDSAVVSDAGADVTIVSGDDAAVIPDAGFCANKCDCDNDGWFIKGCTDAGDADTPMTRKGTGDCDDLDSRRHPQADFTSAPTTDGDWDCNPPVVKAYAQGTEWCKGLGLLGAPPCTAGSGFARVVDCGEVSDLYDCKEVQKGLGTECKLVFNRKEAQACK